MRAAVNRQGQHLLDVKILKFCIEGQKQILEMITAIWSAYDVIQFVLPISALLLQCNTVLRLDSTLNFVYCCACFVDVQHCFNVILVCLQFFVSVYSPKIMYICLRVHDAVHALKLTLQSIRRISNHATIAMPVQSPLCTLFYWRSWEENIFFGNEAAGSNEEREMVKK